MSLKARREPIKPETVILAQDIDTKYQALNRDGTTAGEGDDPFGIAMETGYEGDPVVVCRLGFCPLFAATAADIEDGTELFLADNGQVQAEPAAAGTYYKIGIAEEEPDADGAQFGAWVDCLTYGREVTVT